MGQKVQRLVSIFNPSRVSDTLLSNGATYRNYKTFTGNANDWSLFWLRHPEFHRES